METSNRQGGAAGGNGVAQQCELGAHARLTPVAYIVRLISGLPIHVSSLSVSVPNCSPAVQRVCTTFPRHIASVCAEPYTTRVLNNINVLSDNNNAWALSNHTACMPTRRYLRGELGFSDGYIGADSHNVVALYSAQRVVASVEDAAKLAVTAGLDQDLNTMRGTPYVSCSLGGGVGKGERDTASTHGSIPANVGSRVGCVLFLVASLLY